MQRKGVILGGVVIVSLGFGAFLYGNSCDAECQVEQVDGDAVKDVMQPIEFVQVAPEVFVSMHQSGEGVLLDVRTPEEYDEGHLQDAVLIDFYEADFKDNLSALDRDLKYFVYCRSGNRSGQTIELMQEMSFSAVVGLEGGIGAWKEFGGEIVVDK